MLINFVDFFFHRLQIRVPKIICSKSLIWRNCNRNSRLVNFPCECVFPWKRPIISLNYFECVFQEFWPQTKKQILYRTYVLQNSHFSTKLPLAACGTFLFSKFVCTWLLILHAKIQSLKESGVVAIKSFSIELIEVIVHKCSKKRCFRNIGGTYNKTPTVKYNLR